MMKDIAQGLFIITCNNKERKRLVASTIDAVIMLEKSPKVIGVSSMKTNNTCETILQEKKFALNVYNELVTKKDILNFGSGHSYEKDKYENINYEMIDDIPVIKEEYSNGYLMCEVEKMIETQTHNLFICNVVKEERFNDKKIYTYNEYLDSLKNK